MRWLIVVNNALEEDIISTEENESETKKVNSFADAIDSLGKEAFEKHFDKTANISGRNIKGILRAISLNDWKEKQYGYRHKSLDLLVEKMPVHRMSQSGFGLKTFTEIIKGIQASFEQNELSDVLKRGRL